MFSNLIRVVRLSHVLTVFVSTFLVSVFVSSTVLNAWTYTSPQVAVAQIGGVGAENGFDIAVDAAGNTFTTGTFVGTTDFDPGEGVYNLTSSGALDVFVTKIDALGVLVWAKQIGGTANDTGQTVTLDSAGNIYVSGNFYHTADFDPGAGVINLTSAGGKDAFVAKLDAAGNLVWARHVGGGIDDISRGAAVDNLGNVIVVGYFQQTADFDPDAGNMSLTSAGGNDVFVWKLDSSGSLVWAKGFGGTVFDLGFALEIGANNVVYVTGSFMTTVDFDPGVGVVSHTAGVQDSYVLKLDASGDFMWVKILGGTLGELANAMAMDASESLLITGSFQGTVDFDPGVGLANITSSGSQDSFVWKLDSSGNYVWAVAIGGTSGDTGNSVAVDASGNVISGGTFQGTADLESGAGITNVTSSGALDSYVLKLNSAGSFVWVRVLGGTGADYVNGVATDAASKVYTTGYFNGTVDFDPSAGVANLVSLGAADAFVWSLDALGVSSAPTSSTSSTSTTTTTTTTIAPTSTTTTATIAPTSTTAIPEVTTTAASSRTDNILLTNVASGVANVSTSTTSNIVARNTVTSAGLPITGTSITSFVLWSSLILAAGVGLQLRVRRLVR